MKVLNVNNGTNFCAMPISSVKVKGIDSVYKLYDIETTADLRFLKKMYDSTNLNELMPGLPEHHYTIWKNLLLGAVESAKNSFNNVFIETCDNIPSGIMNYSVRKNFYHINYVITFPNKPGYRVPYAGQILFNELYKRSIDSQVYTIKLQAIKDSPFNPLLRYLRMGFKMLGGDDYSETMRINKSDVINNYLKQNEYINSEALLGKKDVDLEHTLKLNITY